MLLKTKPLLLTLATYTFFFLIYHIFNLFNYPTPATYFTLTSSILILYLTFFTLAGPLSIIPMLLFSFSNAFFLLGILIISDLLGATILIKLYEKNNLRTLYKFIGIIFWAVSGLLPVIYLFSSFLGAEVMTGS